MVDIRLIRYEAEKVKEWIKKRYMHELIPIVDKIKELDELWRKHLKELDKLRHERNEIAKEIGKLKREGKEIPKELMERAKYLDEIIPKYEKTVKDLEKEVKNLLLLVPNEVSERVPIGPDDSYNKPIKYWGKVKVREKDLEKLKEQTEDYGFKVEYEIENRILNYWEILEKANLVDTEIAGRISGSRFYIEQNALVFLDFALSLYALDFFKGRGFSYVIIPPYLMRKEVEEKITYYTAFEESIFHTKEDNLILIPTSEHPIVAIFENRTFREKDLPLRILAWSPAFRKEKTSLTKDIKGIFRVKQFHKVELHSITTLDKDYEELEYMLKVVEEFIQSLELPYRVVINSSGDMDRRAKIQMDLEVWFPGQAKYRETHSLATMGSWVSSKLNIKVERKNKKEYVANLYATGVAVQRTICAILENYYNPNKNVIEVPKVLRKYMPKDYWEIPLE